MKIERKHEVVIKIGADDWEAVLVQLRDIHFELSTHAPGQVRIVSGGCDSNYTVLDRLNPSQTHDAYIEEIEAQIDRAWKPDGCDLITAERRRQLKVEGHTPEHDDLMVSGALACAAASYALVSTNSAAWQEAGKILWPWGVEDWKPKTAICNLVRAGALIAAEIDRLQRLAEKPEIE